MFNRNLVYRILTAVLSLIMFYIILAGIEYVCDSRLINIRFIEDYFNIALLGAAPILFKQYRFSGIFFIGAIIGFGVACYVSFLQGPHPTMAGAFDNMAVLFVSFLIGLIVQIRHNIRKSSPDLFLKN